MHKSKTDTKLCFSLIYKVQLQYCSIEKIHRSWYDIEMLVGHSGHYSCQWDHQPWNPVLYLGSTSNSKTKLKIHGDYCWKGVYLQLYCSNLKYFDLCVSHNGFHFLITTTFDELTPWKNYSFKINDNKNLSYANYVHICLVFIFLRSPVVRTPHEVLQDTQVMHLYM